MLGRTRSGQAIRDAARRDHLARVSAAEQAFNPGEPNHGLRVRNRQGTRMQALWVTFIAGPSPTELTGGRRVRFMLVDMAIRHDLTAKQRRYVEAILGGATKSAAYRIAYGTGNNSPKTIGRNAQRTANSPLVREEISRLTLLSLPQAFDFGVLWQHSIAVLKELSESAAGSVRLRSAIALLDAADAARRLQAESSGRGAERALGKLRELYRAARTMESRYSPAPSAATMPENSFTEKRNSKADLHATDEILSHRSAYDPRVEVFRRDTCEGREEVETDASPRPDVVSASRLDQVGPAELPPMPGIEDLGADRQTLAEGREDRYEWRMLPIPGYFPQRHRRVRVRIPQMPFRLR